MSVERTEAEQHVEEKRAANNRRRYRGSDKLKAERAKDYIRFPAKRPVHAVPADIQIDLRRVKKASDLPDE